MVASLFVSAAKPSSKTKEFSSNATRPSDFRRTSEDLCRRLFGVNSVGSGVNTDGILEFLLGADSLSFPESQVIDDSTDLGLAAGLKSAGAEAESPKVRRCTRGACIGGGATWIRFDERLPRHVLGRSEMRTETPESWNPD